MAILVTGGSGFIGLELAKTLADKGHEVILFDVVPPDKGDIKGATYVKGNISDWPEVLNVVHDGKVTGIFHLAAMLSAQCEANPWAAMQVNALGTYHVLEAARLFGVKKVIFSSSQGIYRDVPDGVARDDTPPKPTALIYAVTKVFGEHLGLYYWKRFGIDFRGVRFAQLIGPGVKSQGFGQFYPRMIESALQGRPFEVWVTEDMSIPLIYLKDAVRFLMGLFEADVDKIKTRIYNSGQILPPFTAGDLLAEIKKYVPHPLITFNPDHERVTSMRMMPRILDDQGARAEWNWSLRYGLEDMVADFVRELDRAP